MNDDNATCAYCGAPAQGNYSIHRDGLGLGPVVPLCDGCGSTEAPTLAEIWDRIAQPCPHGMTRDEECQQCDEADEAEQQRKRDEDGPPDAEHELRDTSLDDYHRAYDEKRSLR